MVTQQQLRGVQAARRRLSGARVVSPVSTSFSPLGDPAGAAVVAPSGPPVRPSDIPPDLFARAVKLERELANLPAVAARFTAGRNPSDPDFEKWRRLGVRFAANRRENILAKLGRVGIRIEAAQKAEATGRSRGEVLKELKQKQFRKEKEAIIKFGTPAQVAAFEAQRAGVRQAARRSLRQLAGAPPVAQVVTSRAVLAARTRAALRASAAQQARQVDLLRGTRTAGQVFRDVAEKGFVARRIPLSLAVIQPSVAAPTRIVSEPAIPVITEAAIAAERTTALGKVSAVPLGVDQRITTKRFAETIPRVVVERERGFIRETPKEKVFERVRQLIGGIRSRVEPNPFISGVTSLGLGVGTSVLGTAQFGVETVTKPVETIKGTTQTLKAIITDRAAREQLGAQVGAQIRQDPLFALGFVATEFGLAKGTGAVAGRVIPTPKQAVTLTGQILRTKKGAQRISTTGGVRVSPTKGRKPKSRIQRRKESLGQAFDPRISFQQYQAILRLRTKGLKEAFVKERVIRAKPTGETLVTDIGLRTGQPALRGIGTPQKKVRFRRTQARAGVGAPVALQPTEAVIISRRAGRPRPLPSQRLPQVEVGGRQAQTLLTIQQRAQVAREAAARAVQKRRPRRRAELGELRTRGPTLGELAGREPSVRPSLITTEQVPKAPRGFRPGTREALLGRLREKKRLLDEERALVSVTEPTVAAIQDIKPTTRPLVGVRTVLLPRTEQVISPVAVTAVRGVQDVGLAQPQAVISVQDVAQLQIVSQDVAQLQAPVQVLEPAQRLVTDTLTTFRTPTPTLGTPTPSRPTTRAPPRRPMPRRPRRPIRSFRPRTPRPLIPRLPTEKKKKKKKLTEKEELLFAEEFIALVRRRGKFVPVGKGTRLEALALGAGVARQTLAATFRVKPTGRRIRAPRRRAPPTDLSGFRESVIRKGRKIPTPGQFIQRRGARLGTVGERRAIQRARRGGFL